MVDFTFLIGKFSCKIMTTMYRNSNGSSQSSCDIKISNVHTEDTVQIGTSIVFWESEQYYEYLTLSSLYIKHCLFTRL